MRFVTISTKKPTITAVYLTFIAQFLAMTALVIFEQIRGHRLAGELAALGGDPRAPGAAAVVGAVTVFAILLMVFAATTVAAAASYLTWLVRARQANVRPAATGPVLAAWLVPGINLIAPLLLIDRAWRGSRPPLDRRHRWLTLIATWWFTWLTALTLILVRLPLTKEPGDLTGLGPIELSATAIAALLCVLTVREINRIQAARPVADPVPARPFSVRSVFRRVPLTSSGATKS